ncbi:MAG: DUF1015 domain-containing protein [Myxococcales bacterium]|nr:DUF1015 domain-containing protein [Myxococcales bacterium]
MVIFRPFAAWRPPVELTAEVAAVPYDVVDTAEARALVADHPQSLLRATRPDVDLPDDADMHGEAAYAAARAAWRRLKAEGALVQDPMPAFYVYAQTMDGRRQVGIAGLASAADYATGLIKKHEHTRPDKEDDRKHHIEAVGAHLEPVFFAFRASESILIWIRKVTDTPAPVDFVAPDGIRHELWPVWDPLANAVLVGFFLDVDAFYIADGHHRTAAAARVGEDDPTNDARNHFLAVAFPHTELRILPYNRVVEDLAGHTPAALLAALEADWTITPLKGAEAPTARLTVSMYLAGQWYGLALRPERYPDFTDPVARLDVSVVQDRVLAPLLGIENPRTATRIRFVGGIRGLETLAQQADATGGVAFALYPTSLEDLMAISDAGQVMPPKSTWFEPKLRSGLVVSEFDPEA